MHSSSLKAALLVVLALNVACGGTSSGGDVACGPGTALQGGVCVPSHTCGAGTVDLNGVCVPQGQGGAAGATTTGTGGGGAGSAGSPATAGAGGSSGAAVGGGAGSAGAPATGGAAGSGQGGSTTSVPCPPKIDLNCDPACGPITDAAACLGTKAVVLTSMSQYPFVVRTPPAPGFTPQAMTECGANGMTAAIIKVNAGGWTGPHHDRIRSQFGRWVVSVDSPMCIQSVFGVLGWTCDTEKTPISTSSFLGTSDPNSLADNVTFDTSDENTELPCP